MALSAFAKTWPDHLAPSMQLPVVSAEQDGAVGVPPQAKEDVGAVLGPSREKKRVTMGLLRHSRSPILFRSSDFDFFLYFSLLGKIHGTFVVVGHSSSAYTPFPLIKHLSSPYAPMHSNSRTQKKNEDILCSNI